MDNNVKHIKKFSKACRAANQRSIIVIKGCGKQHENVPKILDFCLNRKIKTNRILWCSRLNSEKAKEKYGSLFPASVPYEDKCFSTTLSLTPVFRFHEYIENSIDSPYAAAVIDDISLVKHSTFSKICGLVLGGGCIITICPDSISTTVPDLQLRVCIESLLLRAPNSILLDSNMNAVVKGCKALDDIGLKEFSTNSDNYKALLEKHKSCPIYHSLLSICQTCDQADLLARFLNELKARAFRSVVSASSPKGAGKSAALGLSIAGGLAFNYSNIYISSSSHYHVDTVFKFLLKGLDVLGYKEDVDYDLIQSLNPKFNESIIGINVFKNHPQSVRFILSSDVSQKLEQAELLIIDEAATIPLGIVKSMMGPYIVFMASTISGFPSSSPFVYDNMITGIQPASATQQSESAVQKVYLQEPVLCSPHDNLDQWLNKELCLGSSLPVQMTSGFPEPQQCKLYIISRKIMFNGSDEMESFLQSFFAVLNSSSRSVDPNIINEISESSQYGIFVLLPPSAKSKVPTEILCIVIVNLEDKVPGDLIHAAQPFQEKAPLNFHQWDHHNNFIDSKGIHFLHIITHPSCRKMGYGSRAVELVHDYFEKKFVSLSEEDASTEMDACPNLDTRQSLLTDLSDKAPVDVDYTIASFSLASEKFRFWKKAGYAPALISKEKNSEGEHSMLMIRPIADSCKTMWEQKCLNFQKYFYSLLSSECKNFPSSLSLSIICTRTDNCGSQKEISKQEIDVYLRPHRMKSLEKYCQNLQDFHSIVQTVPVLTQLYFKYFYRHIHLPRIQEAILLSYGLQYKSVEEISKELGLPNVQVHGLLNRTIRKLTKTLSDIIEKDVEKTLARGNITMDPLDQSLDEELEEAAKKIQQQQESESKRLKELDLSQFAIRGSEDDWQKALLSGRKTLVSIKSIKAPSSKPEDSILHQSLRKPKPHNKQTKRKR